MKLKRTTSAPLRVLALCGMALTLSSCKYVRSPVPIVPLNGGMTPLEGGQYEIRARAENQPWHAVQTGVLVDKAKGHYTTSFADDAVTYVPAGGGLLGGADTSLNALFESSEEPRSPQEKFLRTQHGWLLDQLAEGFFVAQYPLTYDARALPAKQINEDADKPGWTLGILHKIDDRTWEYSTCDKCGDASIALFGGDVVCDGSGKCTTNPKIADFVADADKNRAMLRRTVLALPLEPFVRLVKIGS